MTATQKLYRITRQHRYNGGGRGTHQLHGEDVLYCGYDRFEAMRIYHGSTPGDSKNCSPGAYYHITVAKSRSVEE